MSLKVVTVRLQTAGPRMSPSHHLQQKMMYLRTICKQRPSDQWLIYRNVTNHPGLPPDHQRRRPLLSRLQPRHRRDLGWRLLPLIPNHKTLISWPKWLLQKWRKNIHRLGSWSDSYTKCIADITYFKNVSFIRSSIIFLLFFLYSYEEVEKEMHYW